LLLGGAFLILVLAFAMLYEGEWTSDGLFALILGLVSVAVSLLVLAETGLCDEPAAGPDLSWAVRRDATRTGHDDP
jgi:hypothetical protein